MMKYLRSVGGIVLGLAVISFVAETIEVLSVIAVHGSFTADPKIFYGVRNQPLFMLWKLVYNAFAAVAGGYSAAKISGWLPVRHGIVLAVTQSVALLWAMANPELGSLAPRLLWIALVVVMAPLIVWGSHLFALRRARRELRP